MFHNETHLAYVPAAQAPVGAALVLDGQVETVLAVTVRGGVARIATEFLDAEGQTDVAIRELPALVQVAYENDYAAARLLG